MRDCDAADSPLCRSDDDPSAGCDSLLDLLSEPFLMHCGPFPATREGFRNLALRLLGEGLASAKDAGASGTEAPASAHQILISVLQLISRDSDRHYALRAHCYLRLLGVEGRPFEAIAAQFGVTRADVHSIYRNLQRRHPGIRARGDKSDAAREQCRERRIGVRKPAETWSLKNLWTSPLPLPLSPA